MNKIWCVFSIVKYVDKENYWNATFIKKFLYIHTFCKSCVIT